MKTRRFSPLKAIRKYCIQCAGTYKEVANCTANEKDIAKVASKGDDTPYELCPLWLYRTGHRPKKPVGEHGPDHKN